MNHLVLPLLLLMMSPWVEFRHAAPTIPILGSLWNRIAPTQHNFNPTPPIPTQSNNLPTLSGPKAQARTQTFHRLDHDGDGKWRKRDLAERLGEFGAGKKVGGIALDGMVGKAAFLVVSKGLMTKFDEDKNGRMDFGEYAQMMEQWDKLVPDMLKSY